jgi:hypothetical protein
MAVYQTPDEDRKLSLIEDTSVGVFVLGLGLGLFYLEEWGRAQQRAGEEENELVETRSSSGTRVTVPLMEVSKVAFS